MALNRTPPNTNRPTTLDRRFNIEPEHLDPLEVQYELRLRGEAIPNDLRVASLTLRQLLANERRCPESKPTQMMGVPSQELEYCNGQGDRLQDLLDQITSDPVTHDRFMTPFIHISERLNRIVDLPGGHNLSMAVPQLNERLDEYYNEFLNRVRSAIRSRTGTIPRNVQTTNKAQQVQVPTTRSRQDGRRTPDYETIYRLPTRDDTQQQAAPQAVSIISAPTQLQGDPQAQPTQLQAPISDKEQTQPTTNAFDIFLRSMQPQSAIPIVRVDDSVASNRQEFHMPSPTRRISVNQIHTSNLPQQNEAIELRTDSANEWAENNYVNRPQTQLSATQLPNHNARLSQQFQPLRERILTPIPQRMDDAQWHAANIPSQNNGPVGSQEYRATYGQHQLPLRPDTIETHANRVQHLPNPTQSAFVVNQPHQNRLNVVPNQVQANNIRTERAYNGSEISLLSHIDQLCRAVQELAAKTAQVDERTRILENANHPIRTVPPSNQGVQPTTMYQRPTYETQDPILLNTRSDQQLLSPAMQSMPFNQRYETNFTNSGYRSANLARKTGNPIHKWNWKFSADKNAKSPEQRDVVAFLKKIELYSQAEQVSYDEIFEKFHYLVDGCVYEWYIQHRLRFQNWQQLKEGLMMQFRTPLTYFMKVAALAKRRQQANESSMDYIASIQREFDEMGVYDEQEKVSIIQNGLNDRLRHVAMAHTWNSVQAMDLHLRTVESADELRKQTEVATVRKPFFPRRNVSAIEIDEISNTDENMSNGNICDATELEVEPQVVDCQAIKNTRNFTRNFQQKVQTKSFAAPAAQKLSTQPESKAHSESKTEGRLCFNCKSDAHLFIDCDQPFERVFCFRCGKDGVRAPDCDCKQSKNA